MTDRYYDAFERFSILTIDGGLDNLTAISRIKEQYGLEIAQQIWNNCCKK